MSQGAAAGKAIPAKTVHDIVLKKELTVKRFWGEKSFNGSSMGTAINQVSPHLQCGHWLKLAAHPQT